MTAWAIVREFQIGRVYARAGQGNVVWEASPMRGTWFVRLDDAEDMLRFLRSRTAFDTTGASVVAVQLVAPSPDNLRPCVHCAGYAIVDGVKCSACDGQGYLPRRI